MTGSMDSASCRSERRPPSAHAQNLDAVEVPQPLTDVVNGVQSFLLCAYRVNGGRARAQLTLLLEPLSMLIETTRRIADSRWTPNSTAEPRDADARRRPVSAQTVVQLPFAKAS
jgi:hypothetical protein